MGKRGPAPMPTKLRVLHGETRPSRINAHEPKVSEDEPEMPETLTAPARVVWERTVRRLRGSKVLSPVDADILATYCETIVNVQQLIALIRNSGWAVRGARGAELVSNPLVRQHAREREAAARLAQQFGLTPSARTGLVTPSESPEELERLLS